MVLSRLRWYRQASSFFFILLSRSYIFVRCAFWLLNRFLLFSSIVAKGGGSILMRIIKKLVQA